MPKIDEQRVIGARIYALIMYVTSKAEYKRLFGSNWNQKCLNGIVLNIVNKQKTGSNKAV